MQIGGETYSGKLAKPASWDECTFLYCSFDGVRAEGAHVTSVFVDCRLEGCDLYWAHFNLATLVGVTFKDCVFRGCAFNGCRFLECRFEGCSFVNDNLGGGCRFDDGNRWYGCVQTETVGLSQAWVPQDRPSGRHRR